VEGGADCVSDAILEVLGPEGTLMMSALTTSPEFVSKCIAAADRDAVAEVAPFDPATARTWAGTVPEVFRARLGVTRSLHPTHSVSAFGAQADEMVRDHENAPGPCGEGTPYTRITREERGFILLLGVGHRSNTTLHGMEELAGCEYVLYPKFARIPILTPSGPAESRTRVHVPFMRRNLCVLETHYVDGCAETVTLVGDSPCRLVHARRMREITLEALAKDPWILLAPEGVQAYSLMKAGGVWTRNPLEGAAR
jgi:aminoglycoside 3-N-acetyltransferase